MIRVDLHSHTLRSSDSATPFERIRSACEHRKIGAIAITDHNRIDGALECAERWTTPRVIVGEEIRTTEGEVIGLFLREFIPPQLSPEETIAEIRRQGGVVYVPHPFDPIRRSVITRAALDRVAGSVDAIEVLNGRLHIAARNTEAGDYARSHRLLAGAGSDGHIAREIGRVGVEMPEFTTAAEFKTSLAKGMVFGTPAHPIVHLASSWTKFRKKYLPGWRSI